MTRAEEIFNELMEEQEYGSGIFKATRTQFSVQKLATYLATLESSKSEEKCKYCISLHDHEIVCKEYIQSLVAPTPPSEEKKCCEKCLQYGGNGTAQAVAVAYCSKPDCPCHSPTQEEKKCLRCELIKMGGEDKPVYHPPHTCSPTPPDAWETSQDYKQAIFAANKALDNPHIDPDGDISTIARQFLRMIERYAVLKEKL